MNNASLIYLDVSDDCEQMFRIAGRVEKLGDGVVLRGVGHAGGGEQASLAVQERTGVRRDLGVRVEPVVGGLRELAVGRP
jgi:hypothetical protein